MDWTFYLIVGGSLVLAFLMAFLGWRERKAGEKNGGNQ